MTRRAGISQDELRRVNTSALLTWVHRQGPTTRARLTRELGLNRSTIGDLTALLETYGLVEELAPDASESEVRRSGRPSLVVSPRQDVTVLAVALDVDRIVIALVALGGNVLERRIRLHRPGAHDVEQVVVVVAQVCRELLGEHPESTCLGVGVSVPGSIRASDGLIHFAPNLGWADVNFPELLSTALRLPVAAGNDANLGVIAESARGAARGFTEVAYIGGTIGVGGGFLVRGALLEGASGYAGEVGHLPVDSEGVPCRCGARGCWETKIGSNQVLAAAGRLTGGGVAAVEEVIEAAAKGEVAAAKALDDAAYWLGYGLRSVASLFNPAVVVLGGTLGRILDLRRSVVLAALHRDDAVDFAADMRLATASLGTDAPLLGAAEIAFAPLLADPVSAATVLRGVS